MISYTILNTHENIQEIMLIFHGKENLASPRSRRNFQYWTMYAPMEFYVYSLVEAQKIANLRSCPMGRTIQPSWWTSWHITFSALESQNKLCFQKIFPYWRPWNSGETKIIRKECFWCVHTKLVQLLWFN